MMRPIHQQRGFSLLEVLGALAIGALLLAGLAGMVDRSLDDTKGQQAALYQAQVTDAVRRYLNVNAAALATQTPTAATVVGITLAQLHAVKFLPDQFADTNPYRQGTCVLVRRPDPANYPGQFDALIVSTGGDKIGDKDLPVVAMLAGSGGGYVAASAPGVARGASWKMPTTAFHGVTCAGSPAPALQGTAADGGHLVTSLFYDGAAQQAADFLYRDSIPGRPDLNRMKTMLRFGAGAVVLAGTACAVDADDRAVIAVDGPTRSLVTCGPDNKWSLPPSWKDPVASYNDLSTLAANTPGDVRMVTGLKRAFTYDGTTWVALAVDQNDNLNVPGRISTDTLIANNEVRSKGTIYAEGHMTTDRDLHVGANAFINQNLTVENDVTVQHDVTVDNNVTVAKLLESDGVVVGRWFNTPAVSITDTKEVGDVCNYFVNSIQHYPQGTVMTDENRRPVVCALDNRFHHVDGL